MAYSLIWLPDVLINAGLKVAPVDGWETRGRGDIKVIKGVMCHHTAGPKNLNMPSLDTLRLGRRLDNGDWLKPPLCNLGLGRDGTYYLVGAGRANHAGSPDKGGWRGIVTANSNMIGIEAEHVGQRGVPWPDIQMEAYLYGVAAILKHLGLNEMACCGHKEYAPSRKPDPSFDMFEFRAKLAQILQANVPGLSQIPAEELEIAPGEAQKRPTLRRGANNDFVKIVQARLGLVETGYFDGDTEAAVRHYQRTKKMVPDGIVGPLTWRVLTN